MVRSVMRSAATALAIALLLSGCSSSDPVAQEPQESAPTSATCTSTQQQQGGAWVEGQLAAFADENFEKAYSYASELFRSRNGFQQFVAIIVSNYGFLVNSRSYAVTTCSKTGEYFSFTVNVTDRSGKLYPMGYTLSLIEEVWGVVAAVVTEDSGTST